MWPVVGLTSSIGMYIIDSPLICEGLQNLYSPVRLRSAPPSDFTVLGCFLI
jgi:hypothetical protein